MGRPTLGKAIGVAVLAIALAVVLVLGLKTNKGATAKAAPALPAEHLAGAQITLPKLLADAKGRPSLVLFWASWCDPCTSEAPAIEKFARSSEGQGRIVGVDWSDARSGASAFVRRFGWTFPTVRDGEGIVGSEYGLTNLPTTFVLDAKGKIRLTLHGPQTGASLSQALHKVEAL